MTVSRTAAFTHVHTVQLNTLLHMFNGLFSTTTWVSRYQKGKTSLDLNEARDDGVLGWQWHQLDHMQTVCTSLQTDNHTNTSSLNFYTLDVLPDAQPTVSSTGGKSTEGKSLLHYCTRLKFPGLIECNSTNICAIFRTVSSYTARRAVPRR